MRNWAFILTGLVVAGCAGDEKSDTAAEDTGEASEEAAAEEEAAEEEGGEEAGGQDDETVPAEEEGDDTPEDAGDSSYSGDFTVWMNTMFGADTCDGGTFTLSGSTGDLEGTGSCSFSVLGEQQPQFTASVSGSAVSGTILLDIWGSPVLLDWEGSVDGSGITVEHSGTTSMSIGDVDFSVEMAAQAL